MQRPVVLPPFLSPQACDFVHLLLQKDPTQRLGHRGIRDVMAHPFFLGVDWDAVHARALPLPLTAAAVHAREMEDEPPGRPVNEFDRFSHYVDGTDRYEQKQLVKRLIARWVQYDLAELDTARRLADDVHGCLPFRGVGAADGAGYCTFSSKKELLASVANEKTLFPQIASYLAKLALRVDEDTMIFESDRCVCQWRAWGWCFRAVLSPRQNSVDAYVCIHGTITVNLNLDVGLREGVNRRTRPATWTSAPPCRPSSSSAPSRRSPRRCGPACRTRATSCERFCSRLARTLRSVGGTVGLSRSVRRDAAVLAGADHAALPDPRGVRPRVRRAPDA